MVGPVRGPILFVSWLGSLAPHALGLGQRWVGLAGPLPLAGGFVSRALLSPLGGTRFLELRKDSSPLMYACRDVLPPQHVINSPRASSSRIFTGVRVLTVPAICLFLVSCPAARCHACCFSWAGSLVSGLGFRGVGSGVLAESGGAVIPDFP